MSVLFERLATAKAPTIREVVGRAPESARLVPGRDAEVPEPARVGPRDPVLTAAFSAGRPGRGIPRGRDESAGVGPEARRRERDRAPDRLPEKGSAEPARSFRETTPARRSEPVITAFLCPAFGRAGAVLDLGRVSEPAGSVSGAGAPAVQPAGAGPGGAARTTALSAGFAASGIPRRGPAPVFAGPEPGRRRRGPAPRPFPEKGLPESVRSVPEVPTLAGARR